MWWHTVAYSKSSEFSDCSYPSHTLSRGFNSWPEWHRGQSISIMTCSTFIKTILHRMDITGFEKNLKKRTQVPSQKMMVGLVLCNDKKSKGLRWLFHGSIEKFSSCFGRGKTLLAWRKSWKENIVVCLIVWGSSMIRNWLFIGIWAVSIE